MPDHFHLVFCLLAGESLSKVMEDTGKFTGRELNKLLGKRGQFWQNGLIAAAELWPYSSANAANNWMLDGEWWP